MSVVAIHYETMDMYEKNTIQRTCNLPFCRSLISKGQQFIHVPMCTIEHVHNSHESLFQF